jgi:hypothetical protein
MRVLVAGVIGGIVLFIWGAVAHMALPIGEMGMKVATNQDAALAAMSASATPGTGVYMLPGMSPEEWSNEATRMAFAEKAKASPYAFVIYQPGGNPVNVSMGPALVKQFVGDTLVALLVAWLMSLAPFARPARNDWHGRWHRLVAGDQRSVLELVHVPDGFHRGHAAGCGIGPADRVRADGLVAGADAALRGRDRVGGIQPGLKPKRASDHESATSHNAYYVNWELG